MYNSQQQKLNWKRIFGILILIGAVGYVAIRFARPYIPQLDSFLTYTVEPAIWWVASWIQSNVQTVIAYIGIAITTLGTITKLRKEATAQVQTIESQIGATATAVQQDSTAYTNASVAPVSEEVAAMKAQIAELQQQVADASTLLSKNQKLQAQVEALQNAYAQATATTKEVVVVK